MSEVTSPVTGRADPALHPTKGDEVMMLRIRLFFRARQIARLVLQANHESEDRNWLGAADSTAAALDRMGVK